MKWALGVLCTCYIRDGGVRVHRVTLSKLLRSVDQRWKNVVTRCGWNIIFTLLEETWEVRYVGRLDTLLFVLTSKQKRFVWHSGVNKTNDHNELAESTLH